MDADGTPSWTDQQVTDAVGVFEANDGKIEGQTGFRACIAGTEIVDGRCVLAAGVLEQWNNM